MTDSTSPEVISETNTDLTEKSDTDLILDNPANVNSTPTIMQPVVRLQRISSEVI